MWLSVSLVGTVYILTGEVETLLVVALLLNNLPLFFFDWIRCTHLVFIWVLKQYFSILYLKT